MDAKAKAKKKANKTIKAVEVRKDPNELTVDELRTLRRKAELFDEIGQGLNYVTDEKAGFGRTRYHLDFYTSNRELVERLVDIAQNQY